MEKRRYMNLSKLLLDENTNLYQIYCDLDGVLVAFDERFEHYTGLFPEEWKSRAVQRYGDKLATQKFWDIIDNQVGIRFWSGASWTKEGQQLWDYIKKYNPILLTAPSYEDSSKEGKTLWVQEHLGDNQIEFKPAKQKHEFSGPNKILIDDKESTILSWKSKNGIGILYENTEDVIRELQKMGI